MSVSTAHFVLSAVLLSSVLMSLACISQKLCSRWARRASPPTSGIGSAGVPGCDTLGLCGEENESRWISACLDARRLISRSPTRSPLLKFPLPCLNSQRVDSGAPVWKTSLTLGVLSKIGASSCMTKAYLCENHTCSVALQMMRYSYA